MSTKGLAGWLIGLVILAIIGVIGFILTRPAEESVDVKEKKAVAKIEARIELEMDRLAWQNKELAKQKDGWMLMIAASKRNLEEIRMLIETLPEANRDRWFSEVEKRFEVKFQKK